MSEIDVSFDPQRAEMETLDDSFYEWLDKQNWMSDYEKNELAHEFQGPERISFTQSDIDEGWGPDYEEGLEVMNQVMEKDMQQAIDIKRDIIRKINEGWYSP